MLLTRSLTGPSQSLGIMRRRLGPSCRRSLSSFPNHNIPARSTTPFAKPGAINCWTVTRPQVRKPPFVSHNGAFQRYQSTSVVISDSTLVGTNATVTAPAESAFKDINEVIDLSSLDLQDVPVHIGYLKSLGLEYGYGPTSLIEWLLEHIHVLAGTQWWASIVLTAVAVRLSMFYFMIGAAENSAKLATIKHITDPISAKMKAASIRRDNSEMWKFRAELNLIHKRAGIKMMRSFLPFIQMPLGFGSFILLRAMAQLPVPGLETGGILWFPNLAIPDPTFLIPIATAGVLHWVLKKGGEVGVNQMSGSVMKFMSYFFPALTFLFTWWLPAGLQLSFFVSGLLSWLQAAVFRWPAFRRFANMTPLPPKVEAISAPKPVITSSINDPKPTVLNKITKPFKETMDEMQTSARESLKKAKQYAGQERGSDGKRSKSEIQAAERYEKKRQAEEKRKLDERYEESRRKRERKRMRENN